MNSPTHPNPGPPAPRPPLHNGAERRAIIDRILHRLNSIYGERGHDCLQRLKLLLATHEDGLHNPPLAARWSPADNVLITYADTVSEPDAPPLHTLAGLLEQRLTGTVDTVHVLPFFPWSSDDGFSVIDYTTVRPEYGDWGHIHAIGSSFRLMFDLVLNHCSRHSQWFADYITGIAPERYYFIEVEPGTDLSAVTRPRPSPLLHKVTTRSGERWLWTTFSADQVDLDFSNPDVLLEFIDIFLQYLTHGARIVRLDAIAYLWKRIGTDCIHLPQTHEIVKLLRDLVELVAPMTILLTETNVPHDQNVSYFGSGDEAHAVYNFSLPPLLLHALRAGTSRHLTRWALSLTDPPPGCTFLNFTASHDGIGVRPLEGLLPKTQIRQLCNQVEGLGGHVSVKRNPDGSTSPYELNITYFDALADDASADRPTDTQVRRFLTSQTVMLALRGIPAFYIHSLLATRNDTRAVEDRGYARAINRHKWEIRELNRLLDDPDTHHHTVFNEYTRRIRIRSRQPAFHPEAPQRVLQIDDAHFAVERTSLDGTQVIVCISNLTDRPTRAALRPRQSPLATQACLDLLAAESSATLDPRDLALEPYQTLWLSPRDA